MCGQLAQHEGFGFEMAAGRLVAMRFNGDAITINKVNSEASKAETDGEWMGGYGADTDGLSDRL